MTYEKAIAAFTEMEAILDGIIERREEKARRRAENESREKEGFL